MYSSNKSGFCKFKVVAALAMSISTSAYGYDPVTPSHPNVIINTVVIAPLNNRTESLTLTTAKNADGSDSVTQLEFTKFNENGNMASNEMIGHFVDSGALVSPLSELDPESNPTLAAIKAAAGTYVGGQTLGVVLGIARWLKADRNSIWGPLLSIDKTLFGKKVPIFRRLISLPQLVITAVSAGAGVVAYNIEKAQNQNSSSSGSRTESTLIAKIRINTNGTASRIELATDEYVNTKRVLIGSALSLTK